MFDGIAEVAGASVESVRFTSSSRARSATLVVVIALLAGACSSVPERPGAEPERAPTLGPSAASKPVGPVAGTGPSADVPQVLDFSAPQLGGGTVDGASFAGRDIAIWFWAPW